MDMVAVLDSWAVEGLLLEDLKIDVMISSQGLQHGIETLPGPPEQLAQLMDGDALLGGRMLLLGGLELPPEGLGLEESRKLLLLVEPGTQGLSHSGVARGWKPLMGGAPVQIAIEALDEVSGRRTLTSVSHPFFARHGFLSFFAKHYTE